MKIVPNRWMWLGSVVLLWASVWPVQAFYNPTTGRWLSRDPITETAFRRLELDTSGISASQEVSIYAFLGNDLVGKVDALGLITFEGCTTAQEDSVKKAFKETCGGAKSKFWDCCMGNASIRHDVGKRCDDDKLHVVCVKKETYFNQCANRCAYTYVGWGSSTVHLCPDFDSAACGPVKCTMVHEMVHLTNVFPASYGETAPQMAEVCMGCPGTEKFPNGVPPEEQKRIQSCLCRSGRW